MYVAKIFITLKPTVNDPPGLTVQGALHNLGFEQVQRVRMGKYIEIWVDEVDIAHAETQVAEMCRKLLANPVIENFRFDLEELVPNSR